MPHDLTQVDENDAPIPPDGLPGKRCGGCGYVLAPWYGQPPDPIVWAASQREAAQRDNPDVAAAHDVIAWRRVVKYGACRGQYPPPVEAWPRGPQDERGPSYFTPPGAGFTTDTLKTKYEERAMDEQTIAAIRVAWDATLDAHNATWRAAQAQPMGTAPAEMSAAWLVDVAVAALHAAMQPPADRAVQLRALAGAWETAEHYQAQLTA